MAALRCSIRTRPTRPTGGARGEIPGNIPGSGRSGLPLGSAMAAALQAPLQALRQALRQALPAVLPRPLPVLPPAVRLEGAAAHRRSMWRGRAMPLVSWCRMREKNMYAISPAGVPLHPPGPMRRGRAHTGSTHGLGWPVVVDRPVALPAHRPRRDLHPAVRPADRAAATAAD